MKQEIALQLAAATEASALKRYQWFGAGNKNAADAAAVEGMRQSLNTLAIRGTIIIGESEIDQAPMLYIGEHVGTGAGPAIDIAVDPIDGTRMTAIGQPGALSVLAAGEDGCFLRAPDMYREKLVVGPAARGVIDLNQPLMLNLQRIAAMLNKPLKRLRVAILAKPRHEKMIASLQTAGIRVIAFPAGDVAIAILVGMNTQQT